MESEELITVLGNKYNTDILSATDEPRSAQELSEELDVPIATCYRRIDELEDADLLELHDRPLTDERRRVNVYRRSVDAVEIGFREEVSVDVRERTPVTNRLDDAWRSLSANR